MNGSHGDVDVSPRMPPSEYHTDLPTELTPVMHLRVGIHWTLLPIYTILSYIQSSKLLKTLSIFNIHLKQSFGFVPYLDARHQYPATEKRYWPRSSPPLLLREW